MKLWRIINWSDIISISTRHDICLGEKNIFTNELSFIHATKKIGNISIPWEQWGVIKLCKNDRWRVKVRVKRRHVLIYIIWWRHESDVCTEELMWISYVAYDTIFFLRKWAGRIKALTHETISTDRRWLIGLTSAAVITIMSRITSDEIARNVNVNRTTHLDVAKWHFVLM